MKTSRGKNTNQKKRQPIDSSLSSNSPNSSISSVNSSKQSFRYPTPPYQQPHNTSFTQRRAITNNTTKNPQQHYNSLRDTRSYAFSSGSPHMSTKAKVDFSQISSASQQTQYRTINALPQYRSDLSTEQGQSQTTTGVQSYYAESPMGSLGNMAQSYEITKTSQTPNNITPGNYTTTQYDPEQRTTTNDNNNNTEIEALRQNLKVAKQALEEAQENKKRTENNFNGLDEENKEFHMDRYHNAIGGHNNDITKATEQIKFLESHISQLESKYGKYSYDNQTSQNNNTSFALPEQVSVDQQIKNSKQQLLDIEKQINEANQFIQLLDVKYDEIPKDKDPQKDALIKRIDELRNNIDVLSRTKEFLESHISQLESKYDKYSYDNQTSRTNYHQQQQLVETGITSEDQYDRNQYTTEQDAEINQLKEQLLDLEDNYRETIDQITFFNVTLNDIPIDDNVQNNERRTSIQNDIAQVREKAQIIKDRLDVIKARYSEAVIILDTDRAKPELREHEFLENNSQYSEQKNTPYDYYNVTKANLASSHTTKTPKGSNIKSVFIAQTQIPPYYMQHENLPYIYNNEARPIVPENLYTHNNHYRQTNTDPSREKYAKEHTIYDHSRLPRLNNSYIPLDRTNATEVPANYRPTGENEYTTDLKITKTETSNATIAVDPKFPDKQGDRAITEPLVQTMPKRVTLSPHSLSDTTEFATDDYAKTRTERPRHTIEQPSPISLASSRERPEQYVMQKQRKDSVDYKRIQNQQFDDKNQELQLRLADVTRERDDALSKLRLPDSTGFGGSDMNNRALKRQIEQLNQQIKLLTDNIDSIKIAKQQSDDENRGTRRQLNQANTDIGDIKQQYTEKNYKIENLNKRLDETNQELSVSKRSLMLSEQNIVELKSHINILNQDKLGFQDKIARLTHQHEQLNARYNSRQILAEQFNEKNNQLKHQIDQLNQELDNKEDQVHNNRLQLHELEKENNYRSQRIDILGKDLLDYKRQLDVLNNKNQQLKQQNIEQDRQIQNLGHENHKKDLQIVNIDKELSKNKQQLFNIQHNLNQNEEEFSRLRTATMSLEADKAKLKNLLHTSTIEHTRVIDNYKLANNKSDINFDTQRQELELQIENLKRELINKNYQISDNQKQLDHLKQNIGQLNDEASRYQQQIVSLDAKNQELVRQNRQQDRQIQNLGQKNQGQDRRIVNIKDELDRARQQAYQLDRTNNDLLIREQTLESNLNELHYKNNTFRDIEHELEQHKQYNIQFRDELHRERLDKATIKATLENFQRQHNNNIQQKGALETDNQGLVQHIESLRRKLHLINIENENLKDDKTKLQQDQGTLKQSMQDIRKAYAEEQDNSRRLTTELEDSQIRRNELQGKITNIYKDRDAKIKELNKELLDLGNQLRNAENRVLDSERKNNNSSTEIDSLKQQIVDLESDRNKMKTYYDELEKRYIEDIEVIGKNYERDLLVQHEKYRSDIHLNHSNHSINTANQEKIQELIDQITQLEHTLELLKNVTANRFPEDLHTHSVEVQTEVLSSLRNVKLLRTTNNAAPEIVQRRAINERSRSLSPNNEQTNGGVYEARQVPIEPGTNNPYFNNRQLAVGNGAFKPYTSPTQIRPEDRRATKPIEYSTNVYQNVPQDTTGFFAINQIKSLDSIAKVGTEQWFLESLGKDDSNPALNGILQPQAHVFAQAYSQNNDCKLFRIENGKIYIPNFDVTYNDNRMSTSYKLEKCTHTVADIAKLIEEKRQHKSSFEPISTNDAHDHRHATKLNNQRSLSHNSPVRLDNNYMSIGNGRWTKRVEYQKQTSEDRGSSPH